MPVKTIEPAIVFTYMILVLLFHFCLIFELWLASELLF